MKKKLFYLFLLLLTFYNIYLCSILVSKGDVNFFNDVARDFLLLSELDQKKIVLIGPRSSTNNLFHGPLWTYINYPAYVLGNGNPLTVVWFWIFLACVFLVTGFFMVKKLFGVLSALAFMTLTSIRMVLHIDGIFHAEAAFFFIPMFLFSIFMYVKSKKISYLIFHILAVAILIQLEVGVGIQFLILSSIVTCWFIFKNKLLKHLYSFFLLPIFLSNFIIFDLRHGLRMAKAILSTGGSTHFFVTIQSWLENRINNTLSLQLIENTNNFFTLLVFILVITFTIIEIKKRSKYRNVYFLFLFYYFGYILLSFFNKGILLFHYIYLLVPLTSLWLVSFLRGKYILFIFPLIGILFYFNFQASTGYVNGREGSFIGKHYNSWKALSAVAKEVIVRQKGKEFGYFVFSPDALAYQTRYAMLYHFKAANARSFEYVKKPITYIIANPPPTNNPYMTHVWWRQNRVNILTQPLETNKYPGGFITEKFNLTKEEQKVPFDKTIELGIHFR